MVDWDVLINNILKAICALNNSAKIDLKILYLQQSNQIIRSIRDMLACTGTISASCDIVKSNKSLAAHHTTVMASLSKLVLVAKIAGGLWPPPDANHSMRYQAGQVLLSVRHFIAVAQDLGVRLENVQDPAEEFDMKGSKLSNGELVACLDLNSTNILNSSSSLISKISKDRTFSNRLIDNVRKTVTDVGQFLSLLEDLSFMQGLDTEFMNKKERLLIVVNELVTAASQGDDSFSAANSLGIMLESAAFIIEATEILLVAAKLLIDQNDIVIQKLLYEDSEAAKGEDSDLIDLQRRTESLQFPDGLIYSADSSRYNPSKYSALSPQVWNRDARAQSADSRLNSAGADGPFTFRKNSITMSNMNRAAYDQYSPQELSSSAKVNSFFGTDSGSGGPRLSDVDFN